MKQPSKIPTAIVSLLGCWGLSFTGFAQPLTPDDFDPVRYYLTSSGVYQAYSVVPLTNRMLLVGSEGQDGHGYVDQLNKVYDDGTRVEHFDSRIRGACTSTFYTLNCTIPRIFAIAELPDGKVLAGGHFDLVDGAPQKSLARHTPAGLIDSTFSPPELDGDVHCIAVLDDGKILIGGAFTLADGLSHRRVARLLPDGRLDPSFNGGVGSFDHNYTVAVRSLALQSDGKIVIGGTYNGNSSIARLNSDGSLDSSFSAQIGNVACLIAEPDGKILVGGGFTSVNGIARSCLARLNSDGSLDPSFTAEANDRVDTMIRQADGRFLIGGQFSTIGGVAQATVARLSSDGIVDAGFNITVQNKDFVGMLSAGFVRGLSLQHNGAVLVAGQFGHVNGFDRIHVARIPNDTASTQDLQISPSGQIDWLRGGSAPEVDQVVFEIWNDDHWDFLVSPNRVLGGWQATAGSLPAYGWVRARGRAAAGFQNGSSMIVEHGLII